MKTCHLLALSSSFYHNFDLHAALNAQLKKQHYTNRISASKGNMKESWKAINELLNKTSKSSNIDCLKESGTEIRNKKDISNTMNNFFCTIGRNLADKIQPAANPLLSGEYEVNKDKTKFNFKTIEVKDIMDAFAKVKTTMSFGNDNISSYFLKLALPYTGTLLLSCLTHPLKLASSQILGKLLELLQFSKMEIRLKNLIIAPYQSCLSYQSSLKSLFSTSCIII